MKLFGGSEGHQVLVCLDSAALWVLLQIFVYTCAKKEYAERILNVLDPQRKLFRYVSLINCFHLSFINSLLDRREEHSVNIYHIQPVNVLVCCWSRLGPEH